MCGIFGYTGRKNAVKAVYDGLEKLEYRGYDSAGIAVSEQGELKVVKSVGKVSALGEKLKSEPKLSACCGIGHTRWATHGGVTEENCHPHLSFDGKVAIVHNGTLENWTEIRAFLERQGIFPSGETDSELIAHLIATELRSKNLLDATTEALKRVRGSYALAVISSESGEIVAARKNSPLIIGKSRDGVYLSSDVPALYGCEEIRIMQEGDVAVLYGKGAVFYNGGKIVERKAESPEELIEDSDKGDFDYYMHKEIYDIPRAVSDTYSGIIEDEEKTERICRTIEDAEEIIFVGCGTAYHAGAAAAFEFEKRLRKRCRSVLASEFVCFPPIMGRNTLCFFISQSGETADTLKALEIARNFGARTVALTNVRNSSVCSRCGTDIYTRAGREVAVASTKAYSAQITAFFAILRRVIMRRNGQSLSKSYGGIKEAETNLRLLIAQSETFAKKLAFRFSQNESVFFIGRGADYVTACEGALKLKETALIHCEALPAGELKHGTLSLIDKGVKVVAIATREEIRDKTSLAIAETNARGAEIIGISRFSDYAEICDEFIEIPDAPEEIMPVFSAIPLQLLAFHTSVALSHSPDKPRNLAKSVTVE